MDESKLVEALMVDRKGQKPDKAPERVMLGKLEMMIYLALNRERKGLSWDWRNVV